MNENKKIQISLGTAICLFIILILIFVLVVVYYLGFVENKNEKETNMAAENIINNTIDDTTDNIDNKINNVTSSKTDNIVLYKGLKMNTIPGIQDLLEVKSTAENKEKYVTKYYNYENGKYDGETNAKIEDEVFEGYLNIGNVKKIAMTTKYNAIPRKYTEINTLPKELEDMADCTSVNINSIDLDGDNKNEYIVSYTISYSKGEIGDGETQASSGIILLDSNYKKISDLVTLENGFWGNIKEENQKKFLSLDKVEYIDIDNDGIMEIIIDVPVYEGNQVSIVKYNKGILEGETNYKASVEP